MKRSFLCLLCWLVLCSVIAAGEGELSLLFLGDDGHHQPALRARQLIPALAKRGIDVTYTNDVSDLNAKTLAAYDGLIVYANHEKISPEQEKALLDYVADGHGFVPLHCASYCFLNSDKYVALLGGQFKSHTTGTFRVTNVAPKHPIMQGFGGFESWDETYVHHRHGADRTVLETRTEGDRDEPWTWVRTHGKGRVFYTAWGHDQRTWGHPGFQNLVERGIRWACGNDDLSSVPVYRERPAFVAPDMTPPRKDVKPFEYVDVGPKIPNYTAGASWGTQEKPNTLMQKPLSPEESLKHYVTPKGFHLELFADERNFAGKPIAMNWDERGRLWICETVDYPNDLQPQGKGRDRIRICEDTDGDWKADKFTVFAENLSIPTAIAFYRGGAIVQDGTQTLYLKDTDGDDKADVKTVLIKGWALGDTHGGVSNFRYGLDNWFWGMQGYNNSAPEYKLAADGSTTKESKKSTPFRMGFFRFKLDNNNPPKVTDLEFVRSTNNNTWGLGFSEEGLVFGSTANHNPSVYMPIANRYYERVKGWAPQGLGSIADTYKFKPITDKIRQVDHHGGYTAGAGHALYTARRYPQQYWNRTAFVCGPTGHLVGTFVLSPNGTAFTSTSPCNLIASDDEWSAPIAAEVGPDGNVWVLDWYNYIVQHNPTPQGFKTGKGNAYESDLRDKKHGRIYRVVYGDEIKPISLADASAEELVAALKNDNMLWRLHAQRLLIERGHTSDMEEQLKSLTTEKRSDEIGQNAQAVHALWTLAGIGAMDDRDSDAAVYASMALENPSAAVRCAAIASLPDERDVVALLSHADVLSDDNAQVRLAALLKFSSIAFESNDEVGAALASVLVGESTGGDPWLLDAVTSAAAKHDVSFLKAISQRETDVPPAGLERVSIVAEHFARGKPSSEALSQILSALRAGNPTINAKIVAGLASGWQKAHAIALSDDDDEAISKLLVTLPAESKAKLVQLATAWGSESIAEHTEAIAKSLLETIGDEKKSTEARVSAAKQLVGLRSNDGKTVAKLLREITPQASPELASGLLDACRLSRAEGIGDAIVEEMEVWTPAFKSSAIRVLLSRPELTDSLLAGIEDRQLQLADLSLDQKQALADHPEKAIAARAKKLLESGGGLPNPDRQKVLAELMPLTEQSGDVALGKVVFNKQCSKCHTHSGEGTQIGPDLTGMAVHPKQELLGHIIDPSASVEGNFRTYTIYTLEGRVHTGMLAGESKTAVELVDAEAKRHTILREDIDELIASPKSLMPEGFEKQIAKAEMVNLLEFLTARGKYLPLDLSKAATIVSTKGMFYSKDADVERLIFPDWKPKTFQGVPFVLVDPQGDSKPNVIMLNGPEGKFPPQMPKSVTLTCGAPAKAIHLLSGVSGWGYPFAQDKSVTMIVRLHYEDGKTEDHELRNGVHFADYIRKVEVPESKLAFTLRNQQIRYLAISPQRAETIENIELVKGPDRTAPIVMAITVEGAE